MKAKNIRKLVGLTAASLAALAMVACEPNCDCGDKEAKSGQEKAIALAVDEDTEPTGCDLGLAKDNTAPAQIDEAEVPNTGVPTRDSIDSKYKWDKSRLFSSHEDFDLALAELEIPLLVLESCTNFDSAAKLNACLSSYFETHQLVNKLTLYANMTDDTEPSPDAKLMQKRAETVLHNFMDKAKGVRDGLLKIDDKTLNAFVEEDASLAKHLPYIKNLTRRASRILAEDSERILSLAKDNLWAEIDLNEISSPSEDVFKAMLSEMQLPIITDETGNKVQLTLSNYPKYRRSLDRGVRKQAVDGLLSTLAAYKAVFANAYMGQINDDIFYARARNYDSALAAYLDKDDIPVELYTNLIETVSANVAPLHRYVSLRKKILGLDTIHLYDLYIPLVSEDGESKVYSYDEATEVITAALAPLGDDYIARAKKLLELSSGSIDLLPHADKRSGAYSASVYGVEPFILMNYQGDLDDVSTLAHELGHSMHSVFSMANQPSGSSHYTMFLAEIASTTNEALLNDYLYAKAVSDQEKINLLADKLETIRGTIYRQAMFAEFEYRAHTAVEEGTPIHAGWLKALYDELIAKYYGPDFTIDPNDGYEWSYIPHFYYKYYVYSYATGLSSALSFAKLVADNPANASRYVDMLKAGSSKKSVELLKEAGVDLTTPEPIERALKEFDETLVELEALLAKTGKIAANVDAVVQQAEVKADVDGAVKDEAKDQADAEVQAKDDNKAQDVKG